MLIPKAWEDKDVRMTKLLDWEKNIIEPEFRYSWLPEWSYVWLFNTNSPYYKAEVDVYQPSKWTTAKWTWNISWTTWQGTVVWTSSPYSSLFNQLNLG
jgi:hypothetical protein